MDKTALTARRIPEDDVEILGVGTIRVRGLSRWELLTAGRLESKGTIAMERAMLAFAMLDPQMTEDDIAAWQKNSQAGEIAPVIKKINELSGISREATKEAYKSVRGEPDAGV